MRKRRYDKLKKAGLCTICGVKPPTGGRLTCTECRTEHYKYYKEAKGSEAFRSKHRKQLKRWRDNNLGYCRRRARVYLKKIRDEVFTAYGGKCVCCDESEFVFLSLDHIHNDGKADRKGEGAGTGFYRKVLKAGCPKHLQLLCHNCNQAKRILGYCPHHPEWARTHVWHKNRCVNCNKTSEATYVVCIPMEFESTRRPLSTNMPLAGKEAPIP